MDTIFALSTGRPPAAIAVVRISGPEAHRAAHALAGDLPQPRIAAVRALHDPASGDLLDEALLLRFDGPNSATGEDVAELHLHGSRAVADAVLGALGRVHGLRAARAGEFTRRAFENGRIDLTEAEGLADLLEAETEAQRRAALAVADGGLRRQAETWRERLLMLSAEAERAIDYAEEDDGDGVDPALSAGSMRLAGEFDAWLASPRLEPLRDGIRVVIAGPPNSGKSSLINMISGYDRAIVSPSPGTTRDYIEVPVILAGLALILTDTAGVREASDIEAIGVERAIDLAQNADILLWMGRTVNAPDHGRRIVIHGKADLDSDFQTGAIPVSSVTGQGISELLNRVVALAKAMLPGDDAIALNRRQAALIEHARDGLVGAARAKDLAIAADQLRIAREAFDQMSGRAGVEDLLDALFARFCLGK